MVSEPREEASGEDEHIDVCEEEKTEQKTSQHQFNQEMASSELTNESAKESNPSQSKSEERAFIMNLYQFMKERGTPIERIPHLGFKQINLWKIYKAVEILGGYELVTTRRLWKNVYDELGGSPGSTSAATCTRRHYERLVLPYERHRRGEEDKPLPPSKPRKQYKRSEEGKGKNEGKKRRRTDGDDPEEHLRGSHPCGRGVCSHSGPWPISSKRLDSDQVLSQDMCLREKSVCQLVMSPLEKKKRLAQASLGIAPPAGLEDEMESERPSVIHLSHSSTPFISVRPTWSPIPHLSSSAPFPPNHTLSPVRSLSLPSPFPPNRTLSPVRSLSPPSPSPLSSIHSFSLFPSNCTVSSISSLSPLSSSHPNSIVSSVRSLSPPSPHPPNNHVSPVRSLSPPSSSPLSSIHSFPSNCTVSSISSLSPLSSSHPNSIVSSVSSLSPLSSSHPNSIVSSVSSLSPLSSSHPNSIVSSVSSLSPLSSSHPNSIVSSVSSLSPLSSSHPNSIVSSVSSLSPLSSSHPNSIVSSVSSLSPLSSSHPNSIVSSVRSLSPLSPHTPINHMSLVRSLSPPSSLSPGSPCHLSVSSEDCVAVSTQKSTAPKAEEQQPARVGSSPEAIMRTCQPLPLNHCPCPKDTSSLPRPVHHNFPYVSLTHPDKTQRHPTLRKPVPVPLSSAFWVPHGASSFTKVVPRSRDPWSPVSLQPVYTHHAPNFKRLSSAEAYGKKTPAPLHFLDRNDKSKMMVPKPMPTQQYLVHQTGFPTLPYLYSGFNRPGAEALEQMKAFPLQPVLLPHLSIPPAQTPPAHALQGPFLGPYEATLRQYPYSVPVWHPPPGYSMTTLQPY